jgi:hypothetical protein
MESSARFALRSGAAHFSFGMTKTRPSSGFCSSGADPKFAHDFLTSNSKFSCRPLIQWEYRFSVMLDFECPSSAATD